MNVLKKVFNFYYEGFKNMNKTGRRLWLIVIIKLSVMFLILKIFFFQSFFSTKELNTEKDKIEYIHEQLTNTQTNGQR